MGAAGVGGGVGGLARGAKSTMADSTLDLHENTWRQAKAIFIENYNGFLSENQTGLIEIIHGYGSTGEGGTIRTRLRKFLERHSALLEYQIGEDVDGNIGHTFIHPVERLPNDEDVLLEDIVEYCEIPRTEKKISGKFVKRADTPTLRQTLRQLEKEGRLTRTLKNNQRMYVAG